VHHAAALIVLPLIPDYATVPAAGDVLGVIRFGRSARMNGEPVSIDVATPPLDTLSVETWLSGSSVSGGTRGPVSFRRNADVLFGGVVAATGDLETVAESTYTKILETVRAEGFPHLLRVWNHVRDINAGSGDGERYKRFCAGRHQALTAGGLTKEQFPAASAVGMHDGELAVHFIAGRKPGTQVENARQVSAYDYPPQYGRRPPSFSRATIADFGSKSLLFISGTASIVGHETRHHGDIAGQTEETLANLEAVASACGSSLRELDLVKVYVRRPEDAPLVTARLRAALPQAKLLALNADVCRRDLLLEVEAVGITKLAG
jgi:chorismate lyase/3-hydroxybenzoate synthase